MIRRSSMFGAIGLLVTAYLAMPYVTLWRLYAGMQSGDDAVLQQLIDWNSVRAGFKEDIADGLIGPPPSRTIGNTLPAFGASFVSGIAGSVVDREVTPQHLVSTVREMEPVSASETSEFPSVIWAFFDGPTRFELKLHCPGQDEQDAPLRVRMQLRPGGWKVTRVWVPQDLVERANPRT
jgi:Protein of unknown function (DUF2939)